MLMLSEACGERQPTQTNLYVYVDDADAAYKRALEADATSMIEPADQFYGDRNAGVKDPAGDSWWIATHIEDVSHEELERRRNERLAKEVAHA